MQQLSYLFRSVLLLLCAFQMLPVCYGRSAKLLRAGASDRALQSVDAPPVYIASPPPPWNTTPPSPPAFDNFMGYYLQNLYVWVNNNGVWRVESNPAFDASAGNNSTNSTVAPYIIMNFLGPYISETFGSLFTLVSAVDAASTAMVNYGDRFFMRVTLMPNFYVCKQNGLLVALPNGYGVQDCLFTITWKHQCAPDPFTGKSVCVEDGESILYDNGGQKLYMSSQLVGANINQQVQCPYSGDYHGYECIVG